MQRLPASFRRPFRVATLAPFSLLALLLSGPALQAQEPALAAATARPPAAGDVRVFTSAREAVATVKERGAHHRVEEWVERVVDETGRTNDVTHAYTVLANGMNYLENGEWRETNPEFVPVNGGWLAARGQHQCFVSEDLFVAGAVTVVSPEGALWKSTPMSLALRDRASGQVLVLGESRATRGELVAPNTVLFRNAFAGALEADVRLVNFPGGVECDVIVRRRLPAAVLLGANPDQCDLVVQTEVFEGGPTALRERQRPVVGQAANLPAAPETRPDSVLELGGLTMADGKAFGTDTDPATERGRSVPVFKRYYQDEATQRVFLEESTPLDSLEPLLEALPEASVPGLWEPRLRDTAGAGSAGFPTRRAALQPAPALPRRADGRFEIASVAQPGTLSFERASAVAASGARHPALLSAGVVLDWSYLNTGGTTTLKSGSTYLIVGPVTLGGAGTTVTVEPCVVKYAPGVNASLSIASGTDLQWLAEPFQPVILTARDDATAGESVAGSTGNPSGTYASTALSLNGSGRTNGLVLTNLRVRHASVGINPVYFYTNCPFTLRHAQFVNCAHPFKLQQGQAGAVSFFLQNLLVTGADTLFKDGDTAGIQAAFLTVDGATNWFASSYSPHNCTLTVTDSILVGTGSVNVGTTNNCWSAGSGSGLFETIGAGAHYLSGQSSVRGVTATQSLAALDASLASATTLAPLVLTNVIASDLTLTPWLGTNDAYTLGYHHAPADWYASNVVVTNATLTLTNGVTVLLGGTKGFQLDAGSKWSSTGSPLAPNRLVRASLVQAGTNGLTGTTFAAFTVGSGSPRPEITARFTHTLLPSEATGRRPWLDLASDRLALLRLTDCQFANVSLTLSPTASTEVQTAALTNNLFDGCRLYFYRYYDHNLTVSFQNNLVRRGDCWASYYSQATQNPTWTVKDNLFDGASLLSTSTNVVGGYNGYTSASATFGGSGNKTSLVTDYVTGPLGRFYYPATGASSGLTNLFDSGSVNNSSTIAFYHFTTLTNGPREGTTRLDIGFHYPVASLNGLADSDSDGLPDYVEDADGNGAVGATESHYQYADSDGDGRSDWEEVYEDFTSPYNNNYKGQGRQFWLRFDDGYNGEQGESPVQNTGVVRAANWNGQGAWFTNSSARLRYNVVETNGTVNLAIHRSGAIRFWFRPDWVPYPCVNTNYSPRSWSAMTNTMRLFEIGGWRLSLSPGGTNLIFETRTNATGVFGTNLIASGLSLTGNECLNLSTNRAWEFMLAYSGDGTELRKDGNLVAIGPPVFGTPTLAEQAAGFTLGNAAGGGLPAMGMIDEVETFTGVLTTVYSQALNVRREHLVTRLTNDTVYLDWTQAWQGTDIKRKVVATGSETTRVTGVQDHHYTDTALADATLYQYDVGGRKAYVGRNLPPTIYRGRLLVLIETNLFTWLPNELEAYRQDLLGDGWQVVTNAVPRMNDAAWATNYVNLQYSNDVRQVKQIILDDYASHSNDLKGVVLLGHVTVPYAGLAVEDGHASATDPQYHIGAWPTDIYYGELDGTWTDSSVNHLSPQLPVGATYRTNFLNNIANDGKFDAELGALLPVNPSGSRNLELFVGRIDFARMPAWSAVFPGSTNVESDLLKRYLVKNHTYRRKQHSYGQDASFSAVNESFTVNVGAAMQINSRFFGTDALDSHQRSATELTRPLLFASMGGYGAQQRTTDWRWNYVTNPIFYTREIPAPFYIWRGSDFVDWNISTDNFFKASLTGPNHGLAAVWLMQSSSPYDPLPFSRFDRLGLTEPLGSTLTETLDGTRPGASVRTHYIIGDPTIRMLQVAPPDNLTHTSSGSTNVTLSWSGAFEPVLGYWVFASPNLDTPFTNRLSANLVAGTSFNYTGAGATGRYYQVRSVGLSTTTGTSVTNLSLGLLRYVP